MKNLRRIAVLFLTLIGVIVIGTAIYNISSNNQKILPEKNSVAVYFVRSYGENNYKLTSIRRKIYKNENRLIIALSELLKGPEKNEKSLGYFTEIPSETTLLELNETKERVIINLSTEFEHGGGSSSMITRLEQVANTALDAVNNKPVYLQINGEQAKYVGGEGVTVPQPLSRNLNMGQNI